MRLPTKILQQIIGHSAARFTGTGHKRALGRLLVGTQATLFLVRDEILEEPFPVLIRDISAETIGLTCPVAMMPSATIIVWLQDVNPSPLAILCSVSRCNRLEDDEFAVGARFVQFFDPSHLLAGMPAFGDHDQNN